MVSGAKQKNVKKDFFPLNIEASRGVKSCKIRKRRGMSLWLLLIAVLAVGGYLFEKGEHGWEREDMAGAHAGVEINAWIEPPGHTGLRPIMLALETGERREEGVVDVPEGSKLSVDLPGQDFLPELVVAGEKIRFTVDNKGNAVGSSTLTSSGKISLRHGWKEIAFWNIRIVRDSGPRVDFADDPLTFDRKLTRLSYEASDDYGVANVSLIVRPVGAGQDAHNLASTVVLSAPKTRHVKEKSTEDLTFLPWAGTSVSLQLEARDSAGNVALSRIKNIDLPKREFSHPLARALVEEREKLLRQSDIATRAEMANIMAGIARESTNYGDDPLVFMALRTGAVRLVLDQDGESLPAVSRLIWQAAARIEDTMKDKPGSLIRRFGKARGDG